MESIRGLVIGFAKMPGKEDAFINRALGTLITLLKKIPKNKEYEFQCEISSLLSEFSVAFMAALAVIHSGRPLQEIEQIEKSLQKTHEGSQIQFITRLLAPLCLQANEAVIEITTFFLHVDSDRLSSCAKEVLKKSGQNGRSKNAIVSVLQKWITRKTGVLTILAKIDPQAAIKRAVDLLTNSDEGIRHEALSVIATGPLTKEISKSVATILKDDKSKVLWMGMCHREVCCDFVRRAFENGTLSKEDAVELLQKAFQYEDCNRGLAHLLPAVKAIDPENKQLLMGGFLAMERKGNRNFSVRKTSVKEFISGLAKEELIGYAKKTLFTSDDSDFCWLVGQYLIAADTAVASQVFVGIAKTKMAQKSKNKIGTLAQLAMKACFDDRASCNWTAKGLNKKPKSRCAPVAQALLNYAESDSCPTEVRLAIAYQPGMFGGTVVCCRQAIPLLSKVILDQKASPEQTRKAIQALLNTSLKRGLAQEVEGALKKIYASPRKKILLDQMLFILVNDLRGYPMEPLYPAIVAFLANEAKETDAVPILKKALDAQRPDGDLGMCARSTYVAALKKIALAGSVKSVGAITDYRGDNIWGDVIPKTLISLYNKSSSQEVREQTAIGVAERFLLSVNKSGAGNLFYLDELIAVEGLKKSPIVQEAFLEGIAAIGEGNGRRSAGMCGIVKKTFEILPKEKISDGQSALNELLNKLTREKKAHIAECEGKGRWRTDTERIKTIDAIIAEASLTLATA